MDDSFHFFFVLDLSLAGAFLIIARKRNWGNKHVNESTEWLIIIMIPIVYVIPFFVDKLAWFIVVMIISATGWLLLGLFNIPDESKEKKEVKESKKAIVELLLTYGLFVYVAVAILYFIEAFPQAIPQQILP